jgi:hypothetical protein
MGFCVVSWCGCGRLDAGGMGGWFGNGVVRMLRMMARFGHSGDDISSSVRVLAASDCRFRCHRRERRAHDAQEQCGWTTNDWRQTVQSWSRDEAGENGSLCKRTLRFETSQTPLHCVLFFPLSFRSGVLDIVVHGE